MAFFKYFYKRYLYWRITFSKHHQCIESLVPLLVAAHGNPQQAMDEAVSQLFSAVDKFEFIAKQLVSTANDTKGDLDSVQKVIEAAQRQCTGHLAWGYVYLILIC